MRNDEVSRCLDYIRFTSELEGFSLSDGDEEILRDILNGDASAEDGVYTAFFPELKGADFCR